ncbi:hypothetical protein YC2023_060726 [Brassica napus]|uniref:Uncharacterized protein n=1 Tax=Brassica oleracea TaxID=3712 RepID=A0A3P6EYY7_BRAOL|nr:unnamed protein product [Brassica oleracea]
MATEKFGPHLPTILKGEDIDVIYELWVVDYAVEVELPYGETPETALAELGMAFAQMSPNFFRYFLTSWSELGRRVSNLVSGS